MRASINSSASSAEFATASAPVAASRSGTVRVISPPIITQTLKSSLADVEISKLEQHGSLAMVVFDRIAKSRASVKGLYAAEALASYQAEVGMEVTTGEVQQILNILHADNLVMRSGHGSYCVSDPYVQKLWEERKALTNL